jgi:hypothetical protein
MKLRMDHNDMEDLHEDLTNLYLKYHDRYANKFETNMELEATIAVSMLEITEDINDKILNKSLPGLFKSVFNKRDWE